VLFKREIKALNIWNMDEKGFRLSCGGKKKRIVQRFAPREHVLKEPRKRESLTVVECMSPEGRYVTPLVIYMFKAGPPGGWFQETRQEDHLWATHLGSYMIVHNALCIIIGDRGQVFRCAQRLFAPVPVLHRPVWIGTGPKKLAEPVRTGTGRNGASQYGSVPVGTATKIPASILSSGPHHLCATHLRRLR
jgi:hypothetical protein